MVRRHAVRTINADMAFSCLSKPLTSEASMSGQLAITPLRCLLTTGALSLSFITTSAGCFRAGRRPNAGLQLPKKMPPNTDERYCVGMGSHSASVEVADDDAFGRSSRHGFLYTATAVRAAAAER